METAVYAAILGMTEAELLDAAFLPVRRLRPRAPRMRTLIGASLLRQSPAQQTAAEQPVIVRNVSERGMCLALRGMKPQESALRHDEIVCIRMPENVEHVGQVRWVEDRAFGVELFHTLDIEALGSENQRRNAHFLEVLEQQYKPTQTVQNAY
ncbi:hypothetical protein ADT71_09685 [Novosphingobium sp. ST904]|nr:hypothetical protein ADT71_09685 [Novosphingobium sp. ST904]